MKKYAITIFLSAFLLFQVQPIICGSNHDIFSQQSSSWILITSNKKFLNDDRLKETITPWENGTPETILWTDDYSNLVSVLSESNTNLLFTFFRLYFSEYFKT